MYETPAYMHLILGQFYQCTKGVLPESYNEFPCCPFLILFMINSTRIEYAHVALDNGDETQGLEYLSNQNGRILQFCDEAGINVKQYLPHYTTQQEWIRHFGEKWTLFSKRKMEFDPRHILATGQRIYCTFA
ncbi:Cytokinin dehydrogenase 5 [Sesamum angolense]|uniref:Cytokinin dehydrogenase 5 n=1 Tax=Sesamum angolense TaxID=2727404 RepID=A0AAE1WC96_9LAMI|nr:Cytokinin dehydrogenase 5 [Sesamum angolense]